MDPILAPMRICNGSAWEHARARATRDINQLIRVKRGYRALNEAQAPV